MIAYKIFILIMMILLHIVEDFHLQGILTNLKQKDWWIKELRKFPYNPDVWWDKYKHDYKVGLIVHSIENAVFVILPFMINDLYYTFTVKSSNNFFIAWIIDLLLVGISHYKIDNLKCNKLRINLIVDQLLHLAIIVVIWLYHWQYLGMWMK